MSAVPQPMTKVPPTSAQAAQATKPPPEIREVLPKQGKLYQEDIPAMVLCKPKLLPLKSVTLEKLEKMQKDAEETVRQQQSQEQGIDSGAGFFS